jgi:hypothetical protein
VLTTLPVKTHVKKYSQDEMLPLETKQDPSQSNVDNLNNVRRDASRHFRLTQYCAGGKIKKIEMGRACGAYEGGREVCTGFLWGSLRERDQWGDPDVDWRIILRWIFRRWEGVVGTGWSGLRIGTGGGH